jgi:sporulation protein YlmC with PRC-barrel domain
MKTANGHTSTITARNVIGTPVKDLSGKKIGKIEDVVLDKLSNNIMFAVVGFGGFLGAAEKFHPLPWEALDYSPEEEAYVVPYSREELAQAPADSLEALTQDGGIEYRNRAFDYYNAPNYW